MLELKNRTVDAQCVLRMLLWVRDEIAIGLKCDEAAATLDHAIEMIGAQFPEAHAEIAEFIADEPWRSRFFASH